MWLSLLGACASTASTPTPRAETESSGSECPARSHVSGAEIALAGCRTEHASDPAWPARSAYDALLPRLSAHLASLQPPREVTADEVQPYADETWELLDRISFPPSAEPARARTEDAVERVLRERDAGSAPGAAIELLDAVTQLGIVADPTGGVDPCAAEVLVLAQARLEGETCTD